MERRPDGTIIVDAYIARVGVLEYQMPDGTVRRELRRAEDVFHPVSLRSFEGRPVTHEHPPDLLDAKTATRYAVGAQTSAVVREGEHVRTRLSIYDARTVEAMESGKLQISCGYTCDCIEQGGVDPIHGPFDAIQINIVGNHIAIVEAGRAGPTASARLDAWTWERPVKAPLAATGVACKNGAMAAKPKKRKDGDPRKGKPDPAIAELQADACPPDDEPMPLVEDAADPDAPAAEVSPDSEPVPTSDEEDLEDLTDEEIDELDEDEIANMDEPDVEVDPEIDPETPVEDGADDLEDLEDEPEETTDAYDGMFDESGEMTEAARGKMSASSFAIPSKSKLPIYDADTVKAAMRRFGEHEFDSAEEKHAAYNRINGRARSFGINTKKFERTHGSKLDAARTSMTQDQKARRDSVRAKIKRRIDSLRNENAKLEGRIVGLTRDLEAARAARKDSADVPRLVAERAALVAQAVAVKVPKFDSASAESMTAVAAMDNLAIKRAIVRHLDGEDLPADKHPQYIEAVYQSAIKRARNDEARARTGAAAHAAARPAVTTTTTVGVEQQRNDSLPDEQAARAALRSNTATSWQRPAHKE